MQLINIKITEAKQSATNLKDRTTGPAFDDLVASIKEKGVLQPVLARILKGKDKIGKYEIIAGNRRLVAAKAAGLEEIPAQIVEMTDIEAREAQIVENLQRQDIHPLEEGELYRKLIEESKYEIPAVAAKVGKAESYIKQRLFLTNLITPAADAYRAEKINDGHAVLIAKLASGDQTKALKAATDRYDTMTVKQLKQWIEENIYSPLERQPWLDANTSVRSHVLIREAVGKCVECEPDKASLFGPIKEGACTSLKCWTRKMTNYINYISKDEKRTKISDEYSSPGKGILSKSEYIIVAKAGNDRCESVHGAIVAQGADIGNTFDICSNKECKTHGRSQSNYSLSPSEKTARKNDRLKAIKAKADRQGRLKKVIAKVKWPMKDKHLEALLTLAFENSNCNAYRNIAKRRELEIKKEKDSWGSGHHYDYVGSLKASVKGMTKTEKVQLAFELLIDTGYESHRSGIGKL